MDLLVTITVLALIALFTSLVYSVYKKKYDIAIGIAIISAALIIMRYVVK